MRRRPPRSTLTQRLSSQESWRCNRLRGLIHQTPNEIPRSWASHSLAFFRLTRSKKGSTPRRILPYRPILPTSRRSAQDDLLGGGVVRDFSLTDRQFAKQIWTPVPTGLIVILIFICRGGLAHPDVLHLKKILMNF